jgi:hypothetical protein
MKNYLFLIAVLISFQVAAQENALAVYDASPGKGVNRYEQNDARMKVENWITQNGYTVLGEGAGTGLKVQLTVTDANTVNAGMRNLTVVEGELVISYQNKSGNIIFGQYRKTYKGSDRSADRARKLFVNAIPSSNPDFKVFLEEMEEQVKAYYQENCDATIVAARAEFNQRKMASAVDGLMAIPLNAPCKKEANTLLEEIYTVERNRICERNLTNAKAEAARKNYVRAVSYLKTIDPEAACFPAVQEFIDQMKSSVESDQKLEFEALNSYYEAFGQQEHYRFIILKNFLSERF